MVPPPPAFAVAAAAAAVRVGHRGAATAAAVVRVGHRGGGASRALGAWRVVGAPSAAAVHLTGGRRCPPSRRNHRWTPPPPPPTMSAPTPPPPTAGSGTPVGNSMMDVSRGGEFVRKPSAFREWVRADGSTPFVPASGRYILYVTVMPLREEGGGGEEGGVGGMCKSQGLGGSGA